MVPASSSASSRTFALQSAPGSAFNSSSGVIKIPGWNRFRPGAPRRISASSRSPTSAIRRPYSCESSLRAALVQLLYDPVELVRHIVSLPVRHEPDALAVLDAVALDDDPHLVLLIKCEYRFVHNASLSSFVSAWILVRFPSG